MRFLIMRNLIGLEVTWLIGWIEMSTGRGLGKVEDLTINILSTSGTFSKLVNDFFTDIGCHSRVVKDIGLKFW